MATRRNGFWLEYLGKALTLAIGWLALLRVCAPTSLRPWGVSDRCVSRVPPLASAGPALLGAPESSRGPG